MREMFYSTQPMEMPDDKSMMEATFKMINAETPAGLVVGLSALGLRPAASIYDLPFLNETAKRNILGANAARLFGLDPKPVKKIP